MTEFWIQHWFNIVSILNILILSSNQYNPHFGIKINADFWEESIYVSILSSSVFTTNNESKDGNTSKEEYLRCYTRRWETSHFAPAHFLYIHYCISSKKICQCKPFCLEICAIPSMFSIIIIDVWINIEFYSRSYLFFTVFWYYESYLRTKFTSFQVSNLKIKLPRLAQDIFFLLKKYKKVFFCLKNFFLVSKRKNDKVQIYVVWDSVNHV